VDFDPLNRSLSASGAIVLFVSWFSTPQIISLRPAVSWCYI
jgi:hypothetical protein